MISRWSGLFLLVLLGATLVGCASMDTENESELPWNRPRNWETGLPSTMFEGR